MLLHILFFGIGGLALVAVGLWGLYYGERAAKVPGFDKSAREHRRGVVRRGCWTCVGLGVVFLGASVISFF